MAWHANIGLPKSGPQFHIILRLRLLASALLVILKKILHRTPFSPPLPDCCAEAIVKGTWCSGITPAQHAGGAGFNPQRVNFRLCLTSNWTEGRSVCKCANLTWRHLHKHRLTETFPLWPLITSSFLAALQLKRIPKASESNCQGSFPERHTNSHVFSY